MNKVCKTCEECKDVLEFVKNSRRKDGYDSNCKKCYNYNKNEYRIKYEQNISKDATEEELNITRTCYKCEKIKSLREFSKKKSCKYGRSGLCRECKALDKAEYRKTEEGINVIRNHSKLYNDINKNIIKKHNADYYILNKDHISRRNSKWVKNNIVKVRIKNNERARNNKPARARKDSIRRARKMNSIHPEYDRTKELVLRNMAQRLQNCLGIKYHLDHILPLIEGGYHHHLNLQPIPAKFNLDKGDSLDYNHMSIIHWSELPPFLLDKIRLEVPLEQYQG